MVKSARPPTHVWLVKAAVFATIWAAGVYVEFGVPVFLALVIFAMFTCGTGEKWAGEASAYSVFNDGQHIAGTMSADQLDAQMRNGGHAPRASPPEYESSFIQNALRGWGGGTEQRPANRGSKQPIAEDELRRRRAAAADAAQARQLRHSE